MTDRKDRGAPLALIGSCFTDIKGFADGPYDPVGRNPGTVETFSGGVARNVAENCLNLGQSVRFISMCDAGPSGDAMMAELSRKGADLSAVLRPESGGNGLWVAVFDENGELAGSISQQPDYGLLAGHLESLGDGLLDGCGALLLEMDLNAGIAETCIRQAQERGVPVYAIVGNLSVIRERKDLLSRCACFVCNEIEAGKLFGCELSGLLPEQILSRVREGARLLHIPAIVVTLGGDGAVYFDASTGLSGHCPAVKTDIVDTTGAGDAFFSACVCALCLGRRLDEAVVLGTELASVVIAGKENTCPPMPAFFS